MTSQKNFVAVGICLRSRCLATIERYTDSQPLLCYCTDRMEREHSIVLLLFHVFIAAETCLPNRFLATICWILTQIRTLMGAIYEESPEMDSGALCTYQVS
jgi:hypothetical protein